MTKNLENSAVATGLQKVSFPSNPKGRQCQRMFKLLHDCTHLTTSMVMLKILRASLQEYMNCELPDVQAGFRKGRETRDQIVNIRWIIEKVREFHKNIYFFFIDYAKAFDCVDHNKLWKILQEMEHQTILPASWEICMQVKKQQLELDMEQRTGSKLGKKYVKAVYCHPTYLTYMQSTSCEMPGWSTSWNQDCWEKYQ